MSLLLKDDKGLVENFKLFVQAMEKEELPDKIKLWASEPDIFGYILVEALVSTRIIGLNVTVDLLRTSINLYELETPDVIHDKARSLAEEARYKYNQIFTDPKDLRQ